MIPFGKQQEILRDLSTSSPEELSRTAGRLFIEDGVVVISNEKSASVPRSRDRVGAGKMRDARAFLGSNPPKLAKPELNERIALFSPVDTCPAWLLRPGLRRSLYRKLRFKGGSPGEQH